MHPYPAGPAASPGVLPSATIGARMNLPLLDHLIFLTDDLVRLSVAWQDAGFTVQDRADEKPGSTVSRFVVFPDGSYVQLAAFRAASSMASNRLGPVMAAGGGWADYSFRVEDLDAAAKRASTSGVALGAVHEVGNSIAAAGSWSLRLLLAGRGAAGDDALPFLVQDVARRDLRVPTGAAHANGAQGIAGISVGAVSPADTAARFRGLLGCASGRDGDTATEAMVGACRVAFGPLVSAGAIEGPLAVGVRCPAGSRNRQVELPGRPGSVLVLEPDAG